MPPIVAFVGHSQSGKTTLIEKLIPELISRGYKVATVKHTHHHVVPDDTEKDSWRHLQAGGAAVVLSSPRTLVMTKAMTGETGLDEISHLLGEEYDLVIAEGFKCDRNVAKIEVHRQAAGPLLTDVPYLLAIVSDEPLDGKVRHLALDDVAGLADLIEESVIKKQRARSVLYADGVRVPMIGFIQELVANIIEGIAASLKGIGEVKRLEVFVRKNSKG
ncbi:MAG: molybdopterin-guanine dinucleotide biosynthesis protein B [Dehalococcoidales bacterium]|nr:molybdopterin-guanine dinucleotide biosynthesis protein B [Dehalococcoidales bacterium]